MKTRRYPDSWEEATLNNVCARITDGTHNTPKKTKIGFPYITAIHVKEGSISFDTCYYVSSEDHEEIYRRCNPEKGDVLFVNIGAGTATPAYIDVDFQFSLKNVALLKPHPNKLDGRFLEALLLFEKPHLSNIYFSGGAQPFLSLKAINKLRFIFPPLPEQRKIAEILSTWDEAITKTEQLIIALQARKKGLMQRLLSGEVRFEGFDGEWKEISIKNMGEIVSGGTPSTNTAKYWKGNIAWATPTDITSLSTKDITGRSLKFNNKR